MTTPELPLENRMPREKQLEIGTWGVFFVWMGVGLLTHVQWGIWLLGVGAITLGAQLARRLSGLRVEGFWIVAGAFFAVGGVSELYPLGLEIALIPLVCIVAGVGLLARAIVRRSTPHGA